MLGFFGIFLIWFAIDAVAFEDEGDVDLGLAAFTLFLTGVALVMLHAWIAVDPDNRRRRARDLALAAAGAALRPLLLDLARGLTQSKVIFTFIANVSEYDCDDYGYGITLILFNIKIGILD
ncbi:hypothetical protein OPV22_012032 [Ensete ventricosum]|uniref:Uncharacterized protein n=1 Tax=Ensete ventricosum TaxID=4639 RepID=A0AAV8R0K1_ENSVE|nr:hypothetical protein OPV22_012032 [Ensete ventricosum]